MTCEARSSTTWEQCMEKGEHDVHVVYYPDTENVLAWKDAPANQDGAVIPLRSRSGA